MTTFSDMIKEDILDNKCEDADTEEKREAFWLILSPMEKWEAFLEWYGIVNWAGTLHRVHEEIFLAEAERPK